jgi:hypothetical protein
MPLKRRELIRGTLAAPAAISLGCGRRQAADEVRGEVPPRQERGPCLLLTSGVLDARREAGKPDWKPVLDYVTALARRSLHPAEPPLPHAWIEIGPGYCYGPAFGHFDLVHETLDMAAESPDVARNQMLNYLALQREDGSFPALAWMGENPARAWIPA